MATSQKNMSSENPGMAAGQDNIARIAASRTGVTPEDMESQKYEDILKLCQDHDDVAQIWFDALQVFAHESRAAVSNECRVIKANGLKTVEAE